MGVATLASWIKVRGGWLLPALRRAARVREPIPSISGATASLSGVVVSRWSTLALVRGCTNFGFALANELIPTAALFHIHILTVFRTFFECNWVPFVYLPLFGFGPGFGLAKSLAHGQHPDVPWALAALWFLSHFGCLSYLFAFICQFSVILFFTWPRNSGILPISSEVPGSESVIFSGERFQGISWCFYSLKLFAGLFYHYRMKYESKKL